MKKSFVLLCGMILSVAMLVGCSGMNPNSSDQTESEESEPIDLVQLKDPVEGQEMAVVKTNLGNISFILYEEYAPNTVAHFKKLVKEGFYNHNSIFGIDEEIHSFFAGATKEDGSKGKIATDDGKAVDPETCENVWHFSGAVSALGEKKGLFQPKYVSDSRFFIVGDQPAVQDFVDQMEENDYPEEVINAYKQLGGYPQFTGFYTVFGQVVGGMDVVNQIVSSDYDEETGRPVENLVIESIELSAYHAADFEDASSATSE
jgi:peptidyl-prolyl cis-trans isomerase B (cyclophilin B)